MDCPEPIKIETPELKVKKNRKFKAKDIKGKIIEIEMGITQNSIIFKAEINNDIYVKKYILIIHMINSNKIIYLFFKKILRKYMNN